MQIILLGEKIKELRQKNNVTQEKLAEYLNITCQSISKLENNNALPDISLAIPLANFFGISMDELFGRNYHCLIALASALWDTLHRPDKFKNSHEQNAGEVITLCQRILKDCRDNKIREEALQLLVYTYANASLSFADETKAVEYEIIFII